MTTAELAPVLSPTLRTAWGSPKKWTGRGRFGVLLSSSAETEVTERTYDSASDVWSTIDSLDAAHQYGATIRHAQTGLQFEVMRLEDGVWRDFLGREPVAVARARWV